MLSYLFYPNPGNANIGSPKVIVIFAVCLLFFALSFAVSFWRKKQQNPVTRKLSRSWARSMRWFGFIGIVLVIARIEEIQFLAMRALWIFWIFFAIVYVTFQIWIFRKKHYIVVQKGSREDPREKYLPGR